MKCLRLGALAAPLAMTLTFCSTASADQTITQTTTEVTTTTPQTVTTQPVLVEREPHHNRWFSTQMGLAVGGGYASFVSDDMRGATNGGGEWDVRFLLGAHSPIGVELGYIGTANSLEAGRIVGLPTGATLLSNAFEGDVRLGTPAFPTIPLQLYGFIGAGINRFDVLVRDDVVTQFNKVDTTFVMPFGGGLQLNLSEHALLDARFTYRTMFDDHLLGRDAGADMYTVTGRLGYLF